MSESHRFDDDTIDDLRQRLRATRWPDAPAGVGWALGVDVAELRDLVGYWADGFDFAAHRAALDALPSRRETVGGIDVHLLYGPADGSFPLLLLHGWPDSGWRYRHVLPALVDAGYDVVVPDMPGYGFSAIPAEPALDSRRVAALWAELMTRLGHERFAVAGGDIGSGVARWLAVDHPDRVVAVHRMDAGFPVYDGDPDELTADEREYFARAADWQATEGAYAAMHRTKPQTAAVGLDDSPAGLAAWIVEKLRSWSDLGDGDLWSVYTRDDVLALLTEYWVTGTIGSAMRMYHANAELPRDDLQRRVEVPSGFTLFPGDLTRPPRAWLERTTRLVSLTEAPHGGHFAPVEQPERYVAELVAFFDRFR